jgi:hypothetical protein
MDASRVGLEIAVRVGQRRTAGPCHNQLV